MQVLLSNDDGVYAPGLDMLAQVLGGEWEIAVVAPDRNRSGASNSLTLDRPLEAHHHRNGFIGINGTPTDCVHLGISGVFSDKAEVVISGINAGGNLGDDVIYSGTVAAAMEGRYLGLPAIAVSLVGAQSRHYESAAEITRQIIENLVRDALPFDTILNINVPDLILDEIGSVRATRLGFRHKAESMVTQKDPYGTPIYWVGSPGAAQDAGPGTDFYTVEHSQVSVTPIQIDLTRHGSIDPLQQWLSALK